MYSRNNNIPIIIGCSFENNTAPAGIGGAISIYSAPGFIIDCSFTDNTALSGGAISNVFSSATITNSAFGNNSGTNTGGAIDNYAAAPIISNNSFISNSSAQGGAIFNESLTPIVSNCTFLNNYASSGGESIHNNANTTISNCIFWNSNPPPASGPQIVHEPNASTVTAISYSDLQGGCSSITGATCGEGNIDADPFFINEGEGVLQLNTVSPCVDAGLNELIAKDNADLNDDGITGEYVPYDLDGNDRIIDGDDDTTATVDMGAYEYLP